MSRFPSTPTVDEPLEDTPPHGVPPVQRAALPPRPARRGAHARRDVGKPGSPYELGEGDAAYDDAAYDDAAYDDDDHEAPVGTHEEDVDGHDGTAVGDEGATDEPVRVTRRHAHRARTHGRTYDAGKGRHLHLTRRGRVLVAVLAAVVVLAGLLAWYENASNPSGTPGKVVVVDVRSGESLGAIEGSLVHEGVVSTGLAFHLWSLVHGAPIVRPGVYQLHRNLSFSAAKVALDAGPNVAQVTVVAGTTLSELMNELSSLPGHVARAFSHAGSTGGVHSPYQLTPGTPLEGLIGTGTYRIYPDESGRTLLSKMVTRFDTQARAAGLTPRTSVGGLNAYQLVTLASIAQKEGYYVRYMGDVARVIFNRLAAGMHLDMTSTVLYSLGKDGGQVTPQEEQLTTPYNTYLHAGLTPTPICTPSVQALRAAVAPPAGTWLYFDLVTAKQGIMKFASTYTQQLALIQEASKNDATHASSGSSGSSGSTT